MTDFQYPEGATVYANVNPSQKLTVRRFAKRVYYCTVQGEPSQKELVYYGREISFGPDQISNK